MRTSYRADGKPIYYELGCGLLDGQIVAAHIVYDKDSISTASTFRMIAPAEGPVIADGVVGEPEYPEPMETESESLSEDADAEESLPGAAKTDWEKENASEESTNAETAEDAESGQMPETKMAETESGAEAETEESYGNDPAAEASTGAEDIPDNGLEESGFKAGAAETGIAGDSALDYEEARNTAEEAEVE